MLMILLRAIIAAAAAVFGVAVVIRIFWLAMTSMQTVGAEILAAIAAMLVYAFAMPEQSEMSELDEFIKSKKENTK